MNVCSVNISLDNSLFFFFFLVNNKIVILLHKSSQCKLKCLLKSYFRGTTFGKGEKTKESKTVNEAIFFPRLLFASLMTGSEQFEMVFVFCAKLCRKHFRPCILHLADDKRKITEFCTKVNLLFGLIGVQFGSFYLIKIFNFKN